MQIALKVIPLSAFLLNACVNPGGYLPLVASDGLSPERLVQLEDAPPPAVAPLPRIGKPPMTRAERREKATGLFISGSVMSAVGTVFMLSGGLLYSIPPRCTFDELGFLSLCGLTQQIGGLSLMTAGALHAGVGLMVVGAGGYYHRSAREPEL